MGSVTRPGNGAPVVSIVVVTYNALEYVQRCLEGVLRRTRVPFELIVVDNASEPDTQAYLRSLPGIRLIQNQENLLWCAGCNQGMAAADPRSRYFLLLNPDIEILREDWLDGLLRIADSEPRVGLVGTQHHPVPFAPLYGYLDGHCLLVRRATLEQTGPLDEVRWPWAGAPQALAIAAFARGWIYKVVHPRDQLIVHHKGASRGKKNGELTRRLRELERARGVQRGRAHFVDLMREHGLRPRLSPVDRLRWLRPLRQLVERFRFYYTPPVTA